jgi:hypothetical protein
LQGTPGGFEIAAKFIVYFLFCFALVSNFDDEQIINYRKNGKQWKDHSGNYEKMQDKESTNHIF